MFEPAIWPAGARQWAAVVLLGLGPVGAAFFAWDRAMKRGDVALLGVASYSCPMLSVLLLIAAGFTAVTPALIGGCVLIVVGAGVAAAGSRNREAAA